MSGSDNGDTKRTDALGRLLRAAGPRPAVPDASMRRARDAARDAWHEAVAEQRTRSRRRSTRRAVLAAAAIVVVAIGAWYVVRRGDTDDRDLGPVARLGPLAIERVVGVVTVSPTDDGGGARPAVAGERIDGDVAIDTSGGGRVALRLPTGHAVRVDRAGRMRWNGADRIGLDAGAVYVDSGPSSDGPASRPVRVVTPHGSVVETGTRYEVRLDAGVALRVRVRDGAVRVVPDTGSGGAPAGDEDGIEVTAGRQVDVGADGSVRRQNLDEDDDAWSWTRQIEEPFVLEGRTLAEFLDWIEGERGVRVRFVDPSARERSGSIVLAGGAVHGLDTEDALTAVLATSGWTWTRDPRDRSYVVSPVR